MKKSLPYPDDLYAKYLASLAWNVRRKAAIESAGGKCERCGCDKRLEVHHKTYDRIERELPEDLEVLCRRCHRDQHGRLPNGKLKAEPRKKNKNGHRVKPSKPERRNRYLSRLQSKSRRLSYQLRSEASRDKAIKQNRAEQRLLG